MEPTQPLQTTDGDTYKQNANHTKANKFKNNNFLSNLKTPYKNYLHKTSKQYYNNCNQNQKKEK